MINGRSEKYVSESNRKNPRLTAALFHYSLFMSKATSLFIIHYSLFMKTPIAKENEKYKTKNPITAMMGFFILVGANGLEPSTSCV